MHSSWVAWSLIVSVFSPSAATVRRPHVDLQPARVAAMSCDAELKVSGETTTTTTCTLSGAATGTVDVVVRATPPGWSATLLQESFTVAPGALLRIPVGVNASRDAIEGSIVLEWLHEGQGTKTEHNVRVAGAEPRPSLKVVQLTPSDATADWRGVRALDRAARHLQIWLRARLGERTVVLGHDPAADFNLSVAAWKLPRSAAWYAGHPDDVAADAWSQTEPGDHLWVFYVDAPVDSIESPGLAVLGADKLSALLHASSACAGVGELGRAVSSAMVGDAPETWATYPNNVLSELDTKAMLGSSVVGTINGTSELFDCAEVAP